MAGTPEEVEERRRKRRRRKLEAKLWEAAYDLAGMGEDADALARLAKRGHRRYHEAVAEHGSPSEVPIWEKCR